jgi:hypothetical protein
MLKSCIRTSAPLPFPFPSTMTPGYHDVASIDELCGHGMEVPPDLVDRVHVPLHAGVPVVDVRVEDIARQVDLDVWIEEFGERRPVATFPQLIAASDDLDVSLRHRLASIAHGRYEREVSPVGGGVVREYNRSQRATPGRFFGS